MTEKDLFNAVNEIDAGYITDAWKNTDNEPLAVESTGTPRLKIFGAAAAFAAAAAALCLVVYINVNSPEGYVSAGSTLSVHSPGDVLPADIRGPDGVRITYGDVTEVTDENGKRLSPDEITADNWHRIVCEGFVYLAEQPLEWNFNSDQMPSAFDGTDPISRSGELSYTRVNVGDTFQRLTVRSARTTFQYHYKGEPVFTPTECYVEFEGSSVFGRGYIMYDNDGALVCVPGYLDNEMPLIYPCDDLKQITEGEYGDFKFNVIQPTLYLDKIDSAVNAEDVDIDSLLGEKGYVSAFLALTDIRMSSCASMKQPNYIRADAWAAQFLEPTDIRLPGVLQTDREDRINSLT